VTSLRQGFNLRWSYGSTRRLGRRVTRSQATPPFDSAQGRLCHYSERATPINREQAL